MKIYNNFKFNSLINKMWKNFRLIFTTLIFIEKLINYMHSLLLIFLFDIMMKSIGRRVHTEEEITRCHVNGFSTYIFFNRTEVYARKSIRSTYHITKYMTVIFVNNNEPRE